MKIDNKYQIGQEVYLKTDAEQLKRLVTGIHIRPTGLTYSLALGNEESPHYDIEISEDKDVIG